MLRPLRLAGIVRTSGNGGFRAQTKQRSVQGSDGFGQGFPMRQVIGRKRRNGGGKVTQDLGKQLIIDVEMDRSARCRCRDPRA
jgi:hypothetical protein